MTDYVNGKSLSRDNEDRKLDDRIYGMCFHRRETYSKLMEAENVTVLHGPHDEVHVVVYTENWMSCQMIRENHFEQIKREPQFMAMLQDTLAFLRQMQE